MQTVEEVRVRVPELQTSVKTIQYDYIKRVGIVTMPDGACVHMLGVISYFSRIDKNVEKIITISGEEIDTCYAKFPSGQWESFPKEIAQAMAVAHA